MTKDDFAKIALSFPGVEEGKSYGKPAFLVNGKFLTRVRPTDGAAVFTGVHFDEREMLIECEPETFFVVPHYNDYPAVLARLKSLHPGSCRNFIERRWREIAPRKLVKAYDSERDSAAVAG
ncbi:MAG TPA: MmcQ/YjbR family DNA-binding protein [Caulobacteraceae bacterium]|nr:MmcQ/YjbR family DNA-binding protein [Caulobacteraceae bacterium]